MSYPLVNQHSWLEYPPFSMTWKYIFIPGPFFIAMLTYRSVVLTGYVTNPKRMHNFQLPQALKTTGLGKSTLNLTKNGSYLMIIESLPQNCIQKNSIPHLWRIVFNPFFATKYFPHPLWVSTIFSNICCPIFSSWWFQPICNNMLVKLDHFPNFRGKNSWDHHQFSGSSYV